MKNARTLTGYGTLEQVRIRLEEAMQRMQALHPNVPFDEFPNASLVKLLIESTKGTISLGSAGPDNTLGPSNYEGREPCQ